MSQSAALARVDHLVVAVRDLAAAEAAYGALLGLAPNWRGTHPEYGTRNVIFGLTNCYLELLAPDAAGTHPLNVALRSYLDTHAEGLFALALGTDDIDATARAFDALDLGPAAIADGEAVSESGARRHWRSMLVPRDRMRGVATIVIQHGDPTAMPRAAEPPADTTAARAVDHVVIFTDDLDGALALWRDQLGIVERWRREFQERGTVNVGLRLGGVTLELVAPLGNAAGERGERLWGLAYEVGDSEGAVARARSAGVAMSDVRTGLGPGTRVATVKWQDRVPTLLIEYTRERRRSGG